MFEEKDEEGKYLSIGCLGDVKGMRLARSNDMLTADAVGWSGVGSAKRAVSSCPCQSLFRERVRDLGTRSGRYHRRAVWRGSRCVGSLRALVEIVAQEREWQSRAGINIHVRNGLLHRVFE
jgi:hypothetical protein